MSKKLKLQKLANKGITDEARIDRGLNDCVVIDTYTINDILHSEVEGTSTPKEISIDLTTGDYICSCQDYIVHRQLCKHIVATLSTMEDEKLNKVIKKIILSDELDG